MSTHIPAPPLEHSSPVSPLHRPPARPPLPLEDELPGAFERGELALHYQPIVELQSGRLRGLEALARWRHPQHGLLRPRHFLPLAGVLGMMPALCDWALEQACRQLAEWRQRLPLAPTWTMSVNVDSELLTEPEFADAFDRILAREQLSPQLLALDVAETALMAIPDQPTALLRRLERRGIALHVDDFGTGGFDPGYLHRVPARALKIDATLVTRMLAAGRHREIIRSIVDLAHRRELEVIAEGVETPLHFQALRELGCDLGQGFYFSRPLDPASLERLLAEDVRWIEARAPRAMLR